MEFAAGGLDATHRRQQRPSHQRQKARLLIQPACRWSRHATCQDSGSPVTRSRIELLPFDARDLAHVQSPWQRRSAPDSPLRGQGGLLSQTAHPQRVGRRGVRVGAGGNRRAAIRAERVASAPAAIARLHIRLRAARQKTERRRRRMDRDPKRRAGKDLAVGAVAKTCPFGIDLGFVRDLPAMTRTGDFHERPPLLRGGGVCCLTFELLQRVGRHSCTKPRLVYRLTAGVFASVTTRRSSLSPAAQRHCMADTMQAQVRRHFS